MARYKRLKLVVDVLIEENGRHCSWDCPMLESGSCVATGHPIPLSLDNSHVELKFRTDYCIANAKEHT